MIIKASFAKIAQNLSNFHFRVRCPKTFKILQIPVVSIISLFKMLEIFSVLGFSLVSFGRLVLEKWRISKTGTA